MAEGPGPKRPRRRPAAVIVTAALAVTLVSAVLGALAVGWLDGGPRSAPGPNAVPLAPATRLPSTTAGTPGTGTPSGPAATPAPPPTTEFRFQPLWPFRSVAEAAGWQRSYRGSGGQPWHLDAAETALDFTRGFLGFTEIDRVVSRSVRGAEAYIGVGYQAEGGGPSGAAVIHLVKIGRGSDAPWEVVGTADTSLTVEQPRYAARVTSPITVGGRITGVDESIRVQVRQPSSEEPIGTYCCRPGGGEKQPWSAQVTFRGAVDPALTVVASTGGHLREVEQFAITGVRRG
ncbi:hypothetical protein [Kribbella sp. C-35]|uniref:hypothetical protein n=1 Tax=Kribbella sp. C-35 TaxID=2789276 RepID=UPI00397BA4E2